MASKKLRFALFVVLLFSLCQVHRISLPSVGAHLIAYSNIPNDDLLYGNTTKLFSDSTLHKVATYQNSVAILQNCSATYLDSADNSKIIVFNCTSTRLQALDSSNVTVDHSSIERIWATGSTTIQVLNSSKVAVFDTADNAQVFVDATQVGELTLNLPTAGFRTGLLNVTLVDSSVGKLNVYTYSGYMSVQKIQPANMISANILGEDGSPSLTLENTTVIETVIRGNGYTRIYVNGCHLDKLHLHDNVTALIEDSTIDLLTAYGDALVIISNSKVAETFTKDRAVVADTRTRWLLDIFEVYAVISTVVIVAIMILLLTKRLRMRA